MNLRVFAKSFMLLVAAALILYGTSGWLGQLTGTDLSFLNDAWRLVAIAVGASLIIGFAYPSVRGIKQGDQLLAFVHRRIEQNGQSLVVSDAVLVTALENGRTGGKIRVQFPNGLHAEGVIESYAGTLTPPTIRLTEAETRI
ncbi:MAG: hypothetical protein V1881_02860 [Candidatus Micrarchaeota archaeon]